MSKMQDLLCIGHITHDTFLLIDNVNVHCDLDDKTCSVSFDYGAKIPVQKIEYGIGGGAANVSIGTHLLGINSYLYTYTGKDHQSFEIVKHLVKFGIQTQYVLKDGQPTDQASIISYGVDRTIFTYNQDRSYNIDPMVLHHFVNVFVSSIGQNVSQIYAQLIDYKKSATASRIFYNPGTKELRYSNDEVREFAKHCDYLIVNVDEACMILNKGLTRRNILLPDLFGMLKDMGVKNIVLTDGESGAYFMEEHKLIHLEAVKVEVAEKTGAGDAFASGFISGLLNDKTIRESVLWGIKNGASVVTKHGAQNGLLNLAAISL